MEALLYFLIWAGVFFVMLRFGCGAHVMGHGHSHHDERSQGVRGEGQPRRVTPETDVDPVCRMSVRTDGAKSCVYHGTVYYFCSAEHRDAFEAEPSRYVEARAGAETDPMEHHHG